MLSHRRLRLITLAFSIALLATPTAAQVVITQATALAGGVTSGDTPGYPITISQPGSYVFGSNLNVKDHLDAIEIQHHDVTIDFNGFRLQGFGEFVTRSAAVVGSRNTVTIKNGTIDGFKGVAILGQSYWRVENMTIVNNHDGIILWNGALVVRSIISGNILGYGVWCRNGCLVEGNIINGNRAGGVLINSGTVLGNTIANNTLFGIENDSGSFVGFGNNTLFGNNGGRSQVLGVKPLQPNACFPAVGC